MMPRLAVAFDIDGTLMLSGGAGGKALMRAVSGHDGAATRLEKMRLDGMTDRSIARQALGADGLHGPAIEASIDRVLARYLELLGDELEKSAAAGKIQLMPGVVEAIDACSRGGLLVGLCTGNMLEGAKKKLGAAGLWGRFAFGGYGSDAEPRAEIAAAALARARALGASEMVIVGDTPRDVEAALAVGAKCVGVATARYSVAELRAAGAALALPDLFHGLPELRAFLSLA